MRREGYMQMHLHRYHSLRKPLTDEKRVATIVRKEGRKEKMKHRLPSLKEINVVSVSFSLFQNIEIL